MSLRPEVLEWGNALQLVCHPGVRQTRVIIQQWFWWLSMEEDVQKLHPQLPLL